MLPAFLITLREVIEASLIVATILGILVKLNNKPAQKTVYVATITAFAVSLALLVGASLLGYKIHILYTGKVEDFIEGVLMILSALFITWAVFFLHSYFGSYKVRLLQKVSHSLSDNEQKGLFFLTFTAVFREVIVKTQKSCHRKSFSGSRGRSLRERIPYRNCFGRNMERRR
jgi:high-affinity iron transporter